MTTPTARLSPTAGLFNALLRLYILRARPVIAAQLRQLDEARNVHASLVTAKNFADSKAAGYIDRTGLDA
ncbi:MAG TPA: hypothetical protein VIP77_02820 [Jiangellaceae bacterium]